MNRAIKILVIDRVFIMVKSGDRARHLVGKKGTAVDSRRGFDGPDGCSRPGIEGRGHSHCGSNRRKGEAGSAGNAKLTKGCIVVHVALSRVGLAPGILIRCDVKQFGVIRRARVQRRVQVVAFHDHHVRYG